MDDDAGPVPTPIPGSNFHLLCDMVIPAIGQAPLGSLLERARGPKYYAGGDCVNGGREVVDAVADGKRAGVAIAKSFEEAMPDLSDTFAGIRSPNPFWLASAPPTNCGEQIMRAFDAGWGGAVWKTIGEPITNVSSRYSSVDWNGQRMMGLNNIELISDRPIETNLREIAEVKKRYPKHAVIASLMVESTREAWHDIVQRSEDAGVGRPGAELRLPAWHERARHGKRRRPGARVYRDDHGLGEGEGAHARAGEADAQHHRHPRRSRARPNERAPMGSRPSTRSTPSPASIWIRWSPGRTWTGSLRTAVTAGLR